MGRKYYFFKEIFPLTDISMYVAFEILLFILSNIKIKYNNRKLR